MISELTEEEILDFLMTSDFDGEFKPTELKYLLLKYRYFYRIIHGRHELLKTDSNFSIFKLEEKIKTIEKEIYNLQCESTEKSNELNRLKTRKLSLSERFKGKIKLD